MIIEDNRLIIAKEITDDMLDDLIKNINNDKITHIQIDTDEISSLCLQQLFYIAKTKKVEINNNFIEKFFENIKYID